MHHSSFQPVAFGRNKQNGEFEKSMSLSPTFISSSNLMCAVRRGKQTVGISG